MRVHAYPRLWCFAHEATEADGRVALGVLAVHFPNCRDGRCAEAFRATAALALAQPTDRPPHDGRGPHRVFPADMERLQLWPFSRAA